MKLLKHAMKVLERVIEGRLRKIVKIDSMQFGFMSGKSTTNAVYIAAGEIRTVKNKDKYIGSIGSGSQASTVL